MRGMPANLKVLAGLIAFGTLAACGGGSGGMSMSAPPPTGYVVQALVSNRAGIAAAHVDANLVNPWGVAFNPLGFGWVADNATSTVTLYDGGGVLQTPVIAVPAGGRGAARPTGVVFNATQDFSISSGGNSGPALFLFSSLAGTISGWSTGVNFNAAVTAYDDGAGGAVYTGLAIGHDSGGNNFLYAADFANDKVDVFDRTFKKVVTSGGFVDVNVPQGYAPFGIQNIPRSDGTTQIYVAYAKVDTTTHRSAAGAGLGYVAVFDAQGSLLSNLINGGALDAPWGMVLAPANFGPFSGALLVGNFGDGTINAFNASTGAAMGALMQPNGQRVQVSGLWGIAFGNGINSQPTNTLFFAAGVNGEADGVYGRIDFGSGGGAMGGGGY